MTLFARLLLPITLTLAALAPAAARPAPAPAGVVAAVADADTLTLADGTVVRLAGVLAPRGPATGSAAAAARAAVAATLVGQAVTLRPLDDDTDRHGRVVAWVYDAAGHLVQEAVVAAGAARVATQPDSRSNAAALLAAEAQARAAGVGLWADAAFRVRNSDHAEGHDGTFQLVEGRVAAVGETKTRTYLNFGDDWRHDFTAALTPQARRQWAAAHADARSLRGRRVRVRGWMRDMNGPLIDVTHPEQIEILP